MANAIKDETPGLGHISTRASPSSLQSAEVAPITVLPPHRRELCAPPERELPNTSLFEILAGGNVPIKISESAVIKHMATLQIKHDLHLNDMIYLGVHFYGVLLSPKSGRVHHI